MLEWQEAVKVRHLDRLSDFLDPRQQEIVRTLIGHDDEVSLSFSGGSPFAERQRMRLTPSYLETTEDDFQLRLFSVDYPAKFVTLEHREVLGSLMNLGLKRDKFGDIFMSDDVIQCVIASEIADYVQANIQTIGKATVRLNRISLSEHIKPKDDWEEATATVSSMRVDVIVAQMYNLSRTKVSPLIERGLVKVNWKIVDRPDFIIRQGDYISVRKYGRAKIMAIEGMTKKDKFRLRFGKKR
ncbi:S4 domain protein [Halalkalibacter krulwichiae]|uniref:S4 domain protein n=1 Tax=Halalkalibacter krulwichiae TaxID=199441 RepID=A0A1X9MCE4_9BACI|nr:S4 domain protein [Halalkalibacter krulwichiae]